jgi:hypothetical protein
MTQRSPTLELEENLRFQQREWRVQRLGWWLLSLFVLAAALGLFGHGPLSRGRAGDRSAPIRVQYERFVRLGASSRITLQVLSPVQAAGRERVLRINREYFDRVRFERVIPEPTTVDVGPVDALLHFAAPVADTGPWTIVLEVEPLRAGRLVAVFGGGDGPALTVTQFAYF